MDESDDENAKPWGLWKKWPILVGVPAAERDLRAREVLVKHEGLIRHFLRARRVPVSPAFSEEDQYRVCQVIVLQAHSSFDPKKAAFHTWAWRLLSQAFIDITRRVYGFDRREQRIRLASRQRELSAKEDETFQLLSRRRITSLNAPIGDEDAGTVEDTIGVADEIEERVADQLEREWLYSKLANGVLLQREKEVLAGYLQNNSMREIAAQRGVSRQYVEVIFQEAVRKLRAAAADEGYASDDVDGREDSGVVATPTS